MNINGLAQAIRARALADTGTGGMFNSGSPLLKSFLHYFGPEAATDAQLSAIVPYCVFAVGPIHSDPGYNENQYEADVEMHIFDARKLGHSAVTIEAISDRLMGDAIAQTNRTPTYGFDRHQLVLTNAGPEAHGPWSPGPLRFVSLTPLHDTDFWHYNVLFTITMTQLYAP